MKRSLLFDERNTAQPFAYTSLVLDAIKPGAAAMGLEPARAVTREMENIGTPALHVSYKDDSVQDDSVQGELQPEAA